MRILPPLTLREWEGVFGGVGTASSCFSDKLSLRAGIEDAMGVDLVVAGLEGGSGHAILVGEIGEVMSVEDAMVPPTPVRGVAELIFIGAFLVIEHDVGAVMAVGAIRAGLCGEPIAMTKGMLELDAALNLRSGDKGNSFDACGIVEPAEPG